MTFTFHVWALASWPQYFLTPCYSPLILLTAPAPMRHGQWAIWVGALYGHHKCTHREVQKYKMKSLWSTQRSTFKEVDVNCHHDELNICTNAASLFLFETVSNFSFFPSLPNLNMHSLPPHAQFSSQIPPLHQGQMLMPSCVAKHYVN